ncbi:unnamed protein product [Brassica rapa]|uniref:Uncharacterized protein n=1 Tax=Brassica campestris TaxID=3711 RepID=A0A8D9M446_BRACM|nr:unnamed protein product [Brassica rapa]
MEEVMTLLKTNDLPLQPGTADLVFRICHNTDKWDLQGKYSKRFSKAGVKLRKTTFDVWMDFAANRGTFDFSTEELPLEGFLLESKPEEAAAVIQLICQTYGDDKKNQQCRPNSRNWSMSGLWRLSGPKLKKIRRLSGANLSFRPWLMRC